VNVTLLFSRDQYVAAAESFVRHQRRLAFGRDPKSIGGVDFRQSLGQSRYVGCHQDCAIGWASPSAKILGLLRPARVAGRVLQAVPAPNTAGRHRDGSRHRIR
jgi:hypothetical protein